MKKYYPELFLFPIFFACVVITTLQSVSAQTAPSPREKKIILESVKKYSKLKEVFTSMNFEVQTVGDLRLHLKQT